MSTLINNPYLLNQSESIKLNEPILPQSFNLLDLHKSMIDLPKFNVDNFFKFPQEKNLYDNFFKLPIKEKREKEKTSIFKTGLNFFNNNLDNFEQGADLMNKLIFNKSSLYDSANTTALNHVWDTVTNEIKDPKLRAIMKLGTTLSNATKMLGTNTDLLTTFDKFGDSTIGQLTGIGIINGAFGKKTKDFSINKNTIEEVGGSYAGSVNTINTADRLANKKYGLFSNKKRHSNNRFIDKASNLMLIMTNIANESLDLRDRGINTFDLNQTKYLSDLNGGIDYRYISFNKLGNKIKRIKKINFHNTIKNSDTWHPIITIDKDIEQFENGGELEWTPVITEYKQGGKSEESSKKESELEETNLKNIIPEGALHAHKHHMENADNLTKKGIPVVDNEGELLAEIEKNEIIFTLEVTKKLEELYSKYNKNQSQKEKDNFAIEAGKLLVEEILFNTNDRTGLINTLLKGGKINEKIE